MSQRRNSHQPLRRRFSVASVPPLALCVAAILIGWPQNLSAQNNPSHRDDDEPAQREASDVDRAPSRAPVRIDLAMQQMAEQVRLEDAPLEQALTAWSQATDVPLLIDWDKLEVAGVSRDTPISLRLEAVPADHLLNLMLRQASTDLATLMYEITPYFLRITTQEQLNRETVVRIYDVQDRALQLIVTHEYPATRQLHFIEVSDA